MTLAEPLREAGIEPHTPPDDPAQKRLAERLRRAVKGEVRFDSGTRGAYSHDASIYRQVPIGVVIPKDADDVVKALAVCREEGVPIYGRGCGTSLSGQCVNAAVCFDFSKYMNRILDLDPRMKTARVQPGVICDELREAAEEHHLTFGPDPATHDHATLGGMIGNNSCGTHSVMAGKTVDNVISLDVITYDGVRMRVDGPISDKELEKVVKKGGRQGEIYAGMRRIRDQYADLIGSRFPTIPRRVSGYNLDSLLPERGFDVAKALVGSESTCVLVLEATVRLVPSPQHRSLLVLGYLDAPTAARAVPEVLAHKPIALENFSRSVIERLESKEMHKGGEDLLPAGDSWLLVEFGADSQEECHAPAKALMEEMRARPNGPSVKLFDDPKEETLVWEIRRSAVGASRVPGEHAGWPNWEDAAVPPEKLGDYLDDYLALAKKHKLQPSIFGHFGQGCVHSRVDWRLRTAEGVKDFRRFMEEAADVVVKYGGSLSGEHGDGQGLAELLPRMFGPELVQAFSEFKRLWDPQNRMNPGKVVNAYRMDQNLVENPQLRIIDVDTHFTFPQDGGSIYEAANRCFGVGKCRHTEGGTMCPSFMATREEKHSTRGRARLLTEMLQTAGPVKEPWDSPEVKEALDLCLACKGCKGDCPVRVDMATYKAEFLAHWYEKHARPRVAYAMGLIYWWARLASRMPRTANFMTHAPLLSRVSKRMAGVAPQRDVPKFAHQTFKEWFAARGGSKVTGGTRVILWPDTFNNHFHPATAIAATEVLEAGGFEVVVPEASLCCGRPLYDYGMLPTAKKLLKQILSTLRDEIEAGTPIVGLEPSCVSVFRDELTNLLPHDQDAHRLSKQTYMLSEFLAEKSPGYDPPKLHGKAVLHGHCHHKSVLDLDSEEKLLSAMGLDVQTLDSGCCGMAGSFGYERGEKYEVSMKCGERVLFPEVKKAHYDTLVVTDGFSCRSQVKAGTEREALHVAEVLRMALEGKQDVPHTPELVAAEEGETELVGTASQDGSHRLRRVAAALITAGAVAAVAARRRRD